MYGCECACYTLHNRPSTRESVVNPYDISSARMTSPEFTIPSHGSSILAKVLKGAPDDEIVALEAALRHAQLSADTNALDALITRICYSPVPTDSWRPKRRTWKRTPRALFDSVHMSRASFASGELAKTSPSSRCSLTWWWKLPARRTKDFIVTLGYGRGQTTAICGWVAGPVAREPPTP